MSNPFTSFDSRLKIYWHIWIAALLLVLILRLTVFLHTPSGERFYLALAFILGTWLPLIFLNGLESYRLRKHLRDHHPVISGSLTTVGLRFFPAMIKICSQDDLGDPVVAALKDERRRFARLAFTMFFTYPVMFIILAA
jgi:hypothetical protein